MSQPVRLNEDAQHKAQAIIKLADSTSLGLPCVIDNSEKQLFSINTLPDRKEPQRILMTTPEHFDIIDVKNAYMSGQIGQLNRQKASEQWQTLKTVFESCGHDVLTIQGQTGLEDMVFTANQTLPGLNSDDKPYVLLSKMRHASRQKEVPYFEQWFKDAGYSILELPESVSLFEGQGDAIWHPGKQLLWGGYGHRTSKTAYTEISALLNVPVIALELPNENFYHLDTAFCVLSPEAVMIVPTAFTPDGLALIRQAFATVIEVDEAEATKHFTCNALSLDNKTVVLEAGSTTAVEQLKANGFNVIEVDTSEFMKSGGSVFCLKMMIY